MKNIVRKRHPNNRFCFTNEKEAYNNDIKPYTYDVEKAKALLTEAGWADSDGDGVLDKVIDGQKMKFEITYNYNAGNPLRETVGLLIQQTFKQAGITLNIKALDWSLYLDELKTQLPVILSGLGKTTTSG